MRVRGRGRSPRSRSQPLDLSISPAVERTKASRSSPVQEHHVPVGSDTFSQKMQQEQEQEQELGHVAILHTLW